MTTLINYKYHVNAIYVSNELKNLGIDSTINEMTVDNRTVFEIKVNRKHFNEAKSVIENLDVDDKTIHSDSEGYLDGYNEWIQNLYNPGYFTGAKIPVHLLDKANWKSLSGLYILIGLLV